MQIKKVLALRAKCKHKKVIMGQCAECAEWVTHTKDHKDCWSCYLNERYKKMGLL